MATYNVNTTSNVLIAVIPDGADRFLSFNNANIDANGTPAPNANIAANAPGTGIRLLGQNAIDYGLKVNENFVHLLENFANGTQPENALQGQLWYDTGNGLYPDGILRVCISASTSNALAEFAVVGGGGPGGNIGEIQYNSGSGSFLAANTLTWSSGNSTLRVIGNVYASGNLQLAAGANAVSINANSTTSNYSLTLPPTAGSNGQVLTTDGTGNLSWQLSQYFIANGTSNVFVEENGNITMSVGGLANQFVLTTNALRLGNSNLFINNILANGNISSANGNLIGNNLTLSGGIIANGITFGAGSPSIFNSANIANVWLGPVSNVHITGGSGGQLLSTDGTGNLSWATVSTSGLSNGSSDISIPVVNGDIIANVNGNQIVRISGAGLTVSNSIGITANAANVTYLRNLDLTSGSLNSVLATDGNGTLSWQAPGAISVISNGTSSISIPDANGNILFTVAGNIIASISNTSIVTANITITNDLSHNGNFSLSGNTLFGNSGNATFENANVQINQGNFYYQNLISFTSANANISLPITVLDSAGSTTLVVDNGTGDITTEGNLVLSDGNITVTQGDLTFSGTSNIQIGNILIDNNNIYVYDDAAAANSYIIGTNGITGEANNVVISNINQFIGNTAEFQIANVSNALTVTGNATFSGANVTLGNVANLHILGGSSNNLLTTDGTGTLSWTNSPNVTGISVSGSISGSANITVTGNIAARGSDTHIQYNNGGNLAGSANLTWNNGTSTISTGNVAASGLVSAANLTLSAGANISGALNVGTATGTTAGEIRASGNIIAFSPSDISLKTNIQPIQDAVYKATHIGGKTFDWTDAAIAAGGGLDDYFVRREDIGVIAQDVQAVLPQAVRTRDDGLLAVDYPKLVALALESIRELKQEIEDIKARLPK